MTMSNVKAELIKWLSAYIKISLKVHLKQPLWKTFTVHSFISLHECPSGWGSGLDPGGDDSSSGGGSDLGAAQNFLEVWTFTWWKGEPLEMNGLDAAQGFESGRSIQKSSWKIAWETTPWRPINHVTRCSEVLDSGEPRTII